MTTSPIKIDDRFTVKEFYLESSMKLFGLEKGESQGTTMGVTYEVDPGIDSHELQYFVLAQKEKLDVIVATMELAKGSFPRSRYEAWKTQLKSTYDKLLKRTNGQPKPGA